MPKLQLYINKSADGYKNLLNINPSTDVQPHIADLSQSLRLLAYDPREKYEFYAVSYLRNAVLFTVIRTLPELAPHHLAATLYIPVEAEIAPERLLAVIKAVADKLKGNSLTADDLADLRSLLADDYPTAAQAPLLNASHGSETVVTFYGADGLPSLADIVSQGLFVPRLARYAHVLIIDSAIGITALRNRIDPIGPQRLATVLPPKHTSEDFAPHVYGHPFTAPVLGAIGEPLSIVWERMGFDRIDTEYTPDADPCTPPTPDTSAARKMISPATFMVLSHLTRQRIEECTITVNGTELSGPLSLGINDLRRAAVSIECPGYQPFSGTLDLASNTQAVVQLRQLRKVYRFELPVDTDEPSAPVKFDVLTTHNLTRSPIEGYEIAGELREGESYTNRLAYRAKTVCPGIRQWIIPAVVAALIGLLVGWLIGRPAKQASPKSQPEPQPEAVSPTLPADTVVPTQAADTAEMIAPVEVEPEATPETTEAAQAEATQADTSLAALVKYLDEQRIWTRQGLAEFPEAEGLFDDMDHYRFDRLKTYWGPLLHDSNSFGKVAYAAHRAIVTKKNPNRKGHRGTYNRPGDDEIQWIGYIYWIDP